MPRIRTIKPEFASDEKLAKVSRDARLTFVLLMTQADDDGLLLARHRQLLGALYPHDDDVTPEALASWLAELCAIGVIRRRETADSAPVVEIANWSRHQRIDHKSKSLILPRLRDDSCEPREVLAQPSRGPRAPTLDLVPRTVDHGPRTDEAAAATLAECFEAEPHRTAYLAYRSAHRMPDGLDATLNAIATGMHGSAPVAWERIGSALVEMRGAAVTFSANALTGFLRRLGAANPLDPAYRGPLTHAEKQARYQAAGERIDAEIAAGLRGELF